MKSKNRLKEVQKNFTNPNGSVFLTESDAKDIAWLIRRVKVLEKTLKFYRDCDIDDLQIAFDRTNKVLGDYE